MAARAQLIEYKSRKASDYVMDDEKCDRMSDIIEYCHSLTQKYKCDVLKHMLDPRYEQAYITMIFEDEWAIGEIASSKDDLIKILGVCDGVNISTSIIEDCFQITFFIDNLWVKKA